MKRYLVLIGAVALAAAAAFAQAPAKPTRHALLVGCTRYDNLPLAQHLRGCANDVVLMREFLIDRFAFPKDNVKVLDEENGDDNRPTKAHIQREFERLARVASKDDQVVILLSGHGSQQPDSAPDDPENYEPDGLDEIFLPADVDAWDAKMQKLKNVVSDNELRAWLKAIRAKGASIVVIVDACHSATMVRGNDAEVTREVPIDQLVPAKAIQEAKDRAAQRAEKSRGPEKTRGAAKDSPFHMASQAPDLVAIYAAQSTEPTIELKLPANSSDARPHGILTFTLIQVVNQSPTPLTYNEIVQRVHARYVQMGRNFPTPLVEGKDRDKEFLGQKEWPGRSKLLVRKAPSEGWEVNGGAIQGLTQGSIVAVFPPVGQPDADKPVGHARVTRLRSLDAQLEPCEFNQAPAPKELPVGGRCEVVFVDYGSQRLKVAVDRGEDKVLIGRLSDDLKTIAKAPRALIEPVADPGQADWLVRAAGGKVALVPASGWVRGQGPADAPLFGPASVDDKLPAWLEDGLGRIARARNLVTLASATATERGAEAGIEVQLFRFPDEKPGTLGEMVPWTAGLRLQAGDVIGFRIVNRTKEARDVSLLFVDSGYGIFPFFPEPGVAGENRLKPGEALNTPRAVINARTLGLEHMVVISVRVKFEDRPIDFTCLAQPTLEQARGTLRGDPDKSLESPVGLLLQNALFAEGGTRGLRRAAVEETGMQVYSWQSGPRSADAPEQPRSDPTPKSKADAPKTDPAEPKPAPASTVPTPASQPWLYAAVAIAVLLGLLLIMRRKPAG